MNKREGKWKRNTREEAGAGHRYTNWGNLPAGIIIILCPNEIPGHICINIQFRRPGESLLIVTQSQVLRVRLCQQFIGTVLRCRERVLVELRPSHFL